MPATREEKRGEKAWKECKIYRNVGGIIEFVIIFNCILWVWFPIPQLNWLVSENFLIGLIIGIIMLIPCSILLVKGIIDAGKETLSPSKETLLYKGIYKYIRHPQTLGEYPMFIAACFIINSLFLVIWSTIFIIISVGITIHYEEKDLVKRFGDSYIEYKKNTGSLFPKFWKKKK